MSKRQVKKRPMTPLPEKVVKKVEEVVPIIVPEVVKVLTPPKVRKPAKALTNEQIVVRNENLAKGRAKLEQMRVQKRSEK